MLEEAQPEITVLEIFSLFNFSFALLCLQPQMDEKIQLGPRAQVTWVKGSSGGAKASDLGGAAITPAFSHPTSSSRSF